MLGKPRQEDHKSKVSLGHTQKDRPSHRKTEIWDGVKTTKIQYVYVPNAQDECNYYVSQIRTTNKVYFKRKIKKLCGTIKGQEQPR